MTLATFSRGEVHTTFSTNRKLLPRVCIAVVSVFFCLRVIAFRRLVQSLFLTDNFRLSYISDFNVPKMDIAFAISATAFQSDANFKKMTDTVKEFIDRFGVQGRVHYSLLTFGDPPVVHLNFSDKWDNSSALRALIDGIPKPLKGAVLAKALSKAQMLFNPASGVRTDAKKILVVLIDRESDSSAEDVTKASEQLKDEGIRIIALSFGDDKSKEEVERIVPVKDDAIKPNITDKGRDIANKIIDNILDGTFFNSEEFLFQALIKGSKRLKGYFP